MMLWNADKRDHDAYFFILFRLFNKLKKQRKLNSDYKTKRNGEIIQSIPCLTRQFFLFPIV